MGIQISGTQVIDDQRNVKCGIVTCEQGVQIQNNGLNVSGIITANDYQGNIELDIPLFG